MIAEVLAAYGSEVAPDKPSARNIGYHISNLLKWWGEKRVSDISIKSCKEYVKTKTAAGAWGDLKVLKAAVKYWHGEYGPLDAMPLFWKPELNEPKERWLTRSEAARLLWAARRYQHLRRMILLGLYTGSRPGVCCAALVADRFRRRHDVEDARRGRRGQEEAGAEGQARPADHGAPEALEAARRR
jgi:integrase